MYTRKDVIMRKTKKPARFKVTGIETIYSRPVDFKDFPCIFDYRNEYSNTLNSAHIFNDFKIIESWMEDIKVSHKPYQKVSPEKEQADRQNYKIKRQIINTGFDYDEFDEKEHVVSDMLYCNEEMELSEKSVDKLEDQEEDPYAVSDDSCTDKNYVPDAESLSSEQSNYETSITDTGISVLKKSCPHETDLLQHCEFKHCQLSALGCCEKCYCLLCPIHFDMPLDCQQHNPPQSNDMHVNKENNPRTSNCNLGIKTLPNENKDKTNKDNEYKTTCDYVNCEVETFSTCKYCQCFLCYFHFMDDNTYTDCANHNNPYKICKTNRSKVKILQNILIETKKNDKSHGEEKKSEKGKDINKIENIIKSDKCQEVCTKDLQNRRKSDTDFIQTDQELPEMFTSRKRRHSTDVHLSELTSSQLLRKRKKYDSSLLQRKQDAKNTRKLQHTVKAGCDEKCQKKCNSMFSEEDRAAINTQFWNMSWQEQHAFIRAHTSITIPKRKYTSEPKRKSRRAFRLKKIDGTIAEVCKSNFLTTLGYEKTNDRILHNDFTEESTDRRGKHQKTPAFDRDLLTQHIESFNPQVHHYRREHAPLRRYLPSDLNITQMHKHFCETNTDQKVSYELYRQHLHSMRISFTCLGNEECEECESYNFHAKETSHDAKTRFDKECTICVQWAEHHRKYKAARKLYNEHKEVKSNTEKFYSADLEKVIMLPRLDMFKAAIFCSRIVAFNETFAPVGKITNESKPLTVIWHQGIAGRKQNDIISAYYHFLLHNRDASALNIWLDNCSAQNKNWLLFSLFIHMVNSNLIAADKIKLFFFQPGHTFMSCDQVHHQVEQAMKKKGKIYDFTDFEEVVASINKSRVCVKSMAAEDFLVIPNYISDRRIQTSTPRAYLKDMVEVCFTRNSFDLKYKNDFEDEYIELRFLNDKYLKNPGIMKLEFRSKPQGIDSTRKAEIMKNMSSIIPKHKHIFWVNLPSKDIDERKGDDEYEKGNTRNRRTCRSD